MRIENGQIKDLMDPVDMQDGMTLNHATNFGATLPITWVNGVQKSNVKQYFSSATVATGKVRFYLTDNGISSGNAVLINAIYIQSRNLFVDDTGNSYIFGNYVIGTGNKYVEFDIRKLNSTSSNGLVNLLGGALSFLTGIVFTVPADGLTVYLQIKGD